LKTIARLATLGAIGLLSACATPIAKPVVGMTREQVLFSLGYPSREDTPNLEASTWRYWTALDDSPVDLRFDGSGKLAELSGKPAAIRSIAIDA